MRWIVPAMLLVGAAHAQTRPEIEKYVTAHEQKIVCEFVDLLAIPNIAADRANIRRNAAFVAEMLGKRGFRTEILETSGNPLVYGEREGRGPTVLYYIHYDGQPVDRAKWKQADP